MVLIATDLPEPVVPAIRRCGMRARFATTGSPPMSLPSARGSAWALSPKALAERISRRRTLSRSSFGSSMPMTERPGMVEQRQASADIERAMSSARPMTRRGLEAGGGLELVHGDDGAGADRDDLAAHAVVVEHGLEHAGVLLERVAREVVADDGRGALQQRERRGAPGRGGVGVEGELGLLLGAGAGALRQRARLRGLDARLGRAVGPGRQLALEDGEVGLAAVSGGTGRGPARPASASARARTASVILAITLSSEERSAAGSKRGIAPEAAGRGRVGSSWAARRARASAARSRAARAPSAAPETARPVRPWAPA